MITVSVPTYVVDIQSQDALGSKPLTSRALPTPSRHQ
jgi:hypothetical protein